METQAVEKDSQELHIFVNRRKFDRREGVTDKMTGAQIAELVRVPADNAVVRLETGSSQREIGVAETVAIKNGEHFLVTRKTVEGGFTVNRERIERELTRLREGGQQAELLLDGRPVVLYRAVLTGGARLNLPLSTDVVVPVPDGYPAAMIDLAALPVGSPFLTRARGNPNQGILTADGRQWQLVSYHPHNGGGAPAWDPSKHGFDTYYGELLTWLERLN